MSDDRNSPAYGMEHLDPGKVAEPTESGELERPRIRRRIDCAGNPEITDRGRVARGSQVSERYEHR